MKRGNKYFSIWSKKSVEIYVLNICLDLECAYKNNLLECGIGCICELKQSFISFLKLVSSSFKKYMHFPLHDLFA